MSDYLARVKIPVVPQPSYDSHLSPPDFLLLSCLNTALKENRYDSIEDIQANVMAALVDIPEQDYVDAITAWKSRLQKCVGIGGALFKEY